MFLESHMVAKSFKELFVGPSLTFKGANKLSCHTVITREISLSNTL